MYKELKQLQVLESKAAGRLRKQALRKEIRLLKYKIKLLEEELAIKEEEPPKLPDEIKAKLAPLPKTAPGLKKKPPMELKALKKKMKIPKTEIGFSFGYNAGIPVIFGEIREHNPFQLQGVSFRFAVGYSQGPDKDDRLRKHALIFGDVIYRLTPLFSPGIKTYLGGGLNYNVYTTGKKIGSSGYNLFLGFEGNIRRWKKVYLEVGYGSIRTGFSPDYNGHRLTLGYRTYIL
jgi:hypothetical protein